MTSAEALTFLDEMKRRGVRTFTFGELSAEFAPSEAPMRPEAKTLQTDTCQCGHGLHEHQSGLCLRGCEVDKCVTEGKAT